MDHETTLAELLGLNLHECEEEVKNIVDKAVKEMSMEKILRDLNTTWTVMEFDHELHPRTGCNLLKASEELIETLEDNQVCLQNLITSKYIAHFLEEVSTWQNKLMIADQVITVWFEVQRTWTHLESIFMSSEDIRKQLPVDSDRFDNIDAEFRVLMDEMSVSSNVVASTNRSGLIERLEHLQKELTLCEKALAEYLETKRLAFPRFYFVSSADLLDVLSNGIQPEMVTKHLTKLFDSIARLKFNRDESGEINTASGMFAKDGEYVTVVDPRTPTFHLIVGLKGDLVIGKVHHGPRNDAGRTVGPESARMRGGGKKHRRQGRQGDVHGEDPAGSEHNVDGHGVRPRVAPAHRL